MPHFSEMPKISEAAVKCVTAGGGVVLPATFVSIEVVGIDDTSMALTARTRARYWPA
ncbi:hypothetical protein D3C85_1549720 [compost metagenome]